MHKELEHTKRLTPQQMELYLSDKLEGKEAYVVERHLLDCEFCSDALTGLEETKQFHGFSDDIEILKTRIDNRVAEGGTKVAINWRAIGIAATILILVGVGSLMFLIEPPAVVKPQITEKKNAPIKKKSLPEDTLAAVKIFAPQKTLVADAKPKPDLKALTDAEIEPTNEEVEEEADMIIEDEAATNEVIDTKPMFSKTYSLSAPQVSSIGIPLDSFNLISDSTQISEVIVSEEKVKEMIEEMDEVKLNSIQTLDAVTISKSPNRRAKAKNELAEPLTPQPLTGFIKYDEYLVNNLNYPNEAKQNGISGRVVVSFKLNEFGKPIKLKVTKSLGYGCDEEAIRLIENGPLWNTESKDRIEYRVEFK